MKNFDKGGGVLNPDFKICSYEREKILTNSNKRRIFTRLQDERPTKDAKGGDRSEGQDSTASIHAEKEEDGNI